MLTLDIPLHDRLQYIYVRTDRNFLQKKLAPKVAEIILQEENFIRLTYKDPNSTVDIQQSVQGLLARVKSESATLEVLTDKEIQAVIEDVVKNEGAGRIRIVYSRLTEADAQNLPISQDMKVGQPVFFCRSSNALRLMCDKLLQIDQERAQEIRIKKEEERRKNMNVIEILGGGLPSTDSFFTTKDKERSSLGRLVRLDASKFTQVCESIENGRIAFLTTRQSLSELRSIADALLCFAVRHSPNLIAADITTAALSSSKLESYRGATDIIELDRTSLISLDAEPRLQRFLRLNTPKANPNKIFQMDELLKRTAANARCLLVLIPDSQYAEPIVKALVANAILLKREDAAVPVVFILYAERNPEKLEKLIGARVEKLSRETIIAQRANKRYQFSRTSRGDNVDIEPQYNTLFNTMLERGVKEFYFLFNRSEHTRTAVYNFDVGGFVDFIDGRVILHPLLTQNVLGEEVVNWLRTHRALIEDCLHFNFEYTDEGDGLGTSFVIVKINLDTMKETHHEIRNLRVLYEGQLVKIEGAENGSRTGLVPVKEWFDDFRVVFLKGLI